MVDPSIAVAADYAEALLVARRAKNALVGFLALVIVVQIALAAMKLGGVMPEAFRAPAETTQLAAVAQPATAPAEGNLRWAPVFQYAVELTHFAGTVLVIALALVLLLIANIMLVARLIGVGQSTSAFAWSILLVILLLPWQGFWPSADPVAAGFRVPGVLYIWSELVHLHGEQFMSDGAVLRWARWVAFPLVAVILLLTIQLKSRRGLRKALGEDQEVRSDFPEAPGV
jgi:hypothetical protein